MPSALPTREKCDAQLTVRKNPLWLVHDTPLGLTLAVVDSDDEGHF